MKPRLLGICVIIITVLTLPLLVILVKNYNDAYNKAQKLLDGPQSSPTIVNSVQSPIATPNLDKLPYLEDKKIDGKIWAFRGISSHGDRSAHPTSFGVLDNNILKPVDKDTNFWITRKITEDTRDFWYVENRNLLYTVNQLFGGNLYESIVEVTKTDFSLDRSTSTTVAYTSDYPSYGGTQIIAYNSNGTIYLNTGAGDGCGGMGTIWQVTEGGKKKDLQKYGTGCVASEKLLGLAGISNNNVVLYSVTPNLNLLPPSEFSIKQLYLYNLLTGSKKNISVEASKLKFVTSASVTKENPNLILLTESGKNMVNRNYLFDLKTNTLEETTSSFWPENQD